MTTYAIGDIQGCARSFEGLLEAIGFDSSAPSADRLWLAGDLVNRGPDSLGVLRRVMSLEDRAIVVLGNHDLHLLAIAADVRPPWPGDTIDEILAAPDRDALIDWLRRQPLLHHDPRTRTVLVHAGLPPGWSLTEALDRAAEVEEALAGPAWRDVLQTLYGNAPRAWSPGLGPEDRRRYTINALTRMRYCDAAGRLDFAHNGPPGTQPPGLRPWFELRDPGSDTGPGPDTGPDTGEPHIVFGHWASLGLVREPGYSCIDTGCVWGRSLTALPLDPPGRPGETGEPVSVPCLDDARYDLP